MHPPIEPPPIIAILRGIRPDEIIDIADALFEAGIRAIEVPLNSPDPYASLQRLCSAYAAKCLCGAGTVTTAADVERVHSAGGSLVVAPNTDAAVIGRAVDLGMLPMPGFATATEAFAALFAGAQHLKLFPAASCGPAHVRALRAVLPESTRIFAVGGVEIPAMQQWLSAGVAGFGIGGELYRPGQTAAEVARRANTIVQAFRSAAAACT